MAEFLRHQDVFISCIFSRPHQLFCTRVVKLCALRSAFTAVSGNINAELLTAHYLTGGYLYVLFQRNVCPVWIVLLHHSDRSEYTVCKLHCVLCVSTEVIMYNKG